MYVPKGIKETFVNKVTASSYCTQIPIFSMCLKNQIHLNIVTYDSSSMCLQQSVIALVTMEERVLSQTDVCALQSTRAELAHLQ